MWRRSGDRSEPKRRKGNMRQHIALFLLVLSGGRTDRLPVPTSPLTQRSGLITLLQWAREAKPDGDDGRKTTTPRCTFLTV